jgi:hypothetical protein
MTVRRRRVRVPSVVCSCLSVLSPITRTSRKEATDVCSQRSAFDKDSRSYAGVVSRNARSAKANVNPTSSAPAIAQPAIGARSDKDEAFCAIKAVHAMGKTPKLGHTAEEIALSPRDIRQSQNRRQ